jgi:hypothetical protein
MTKIIFGFKGIVMEMVFGFKGLVEEVVFDTEESRVVFVMSEKLKLGGVFDLKKGSF